MMKDYSEIVIGICIAFLMAAILLPIGLNTLANSTMTNVNPSVKIVVTVVMPILVALACALAFWLDNTHRQNT